MLQMSAKQGATYEEKSWRTTFLKNARRTMARDQYQCYWPITKIQQERYYRSHSGPIYENSLAQVLENTLDTDNFFFLLFNFSNFILILFSFSF